MLPLESKWVLANFSSGSRNSLSRVRDGKFSQSTETKCFGRSLFVLRIINMYVGKETKYFNNCRQKSREVWCQLETSAVSFPLKEGGSGGRENIFHPIRNCFTNSAVGVVITMTNGTEVQEGPRMIHGYSVASWKLINILPCPISCSGFCCVWRVSYSAAR